MTISQQTASPLDTTKEAGPEACMEAVVSARDTTHCVPPPPAQVVRESRTRTYRPDAELQEETSLAEAVERWLDDGGKPDQEPEPDGESSSVAIIVANCSIEVQGTAIVEERIVQSKRRANENEEAFTIYAETKGQD